jgi:hypothetical protein
MDEADISLQQQVFVAADCYSLSESVIKLGCTLLPA